MPDAKITQLPNATLPLAGTEKAEVVQGGVNKQVDVSELGTPGIQSIVAGTNVTVDDTDPLNPIVSASGGGTGSVESVTGDGVDNTDPDNPVIVMDDKINALLTIKTKTASHTLDADDLADVEEGEALNFIMDVAAPNDFTIPPNSTRAFPIGTQMLIDYINTGATSFVAGSGVTILSADGLTISARYKGVVAKKIATNTWLLQGALTA